MSTEALIAIAIGTLVVVALIAMLTIGPWNPGRRQEARRQEALQLRQEAQQHFARAGEQETVAQEAARRAERERHEAEEVLRRAEDKDPDQRT